MLIKLNSACRRFAFWIERSSIKNLFLLRVLSKNMSFLMISYTRFFLNQGTICKAFTRKDKRTSIIRRVSPSSLALANLVLCSSITFSLNNSLRSQRPSLVRILLYLPSCTLQLSIVSPRFSATLLPSLMLCSCCRQLIAMLKIQRADYKTEHCYLVSCLSSRDGFCSSATLSSKNFL